MKIFALVFLLAASLSADSIWSFGIGRMPGTDVSVENETKDHAPIQWAINENTVSGIVSYGANPHIIYKGPGYGDIIITCRMCESVQEVVPEVPHIPTWTENESLAGNIPPPNVSETASLAEAVPAIGKYVKQLKKSLDPQKWIRGEDKKNMKKELDRWFSVYRRIAAARPVLICENPKAITIRTRISYDISNRISVPIIIRGDRTPNNGRDHGYIVEGPVDKWY